MEIKFLTDWKKKAGLFNLLFCKKSCRDNGNEGSNELVLYIWITLTKVEFDSENRAKIISSLNPTKAHNHDRLSILMLKLCCKSSCK